MSFHPRAPVLQRLFHGCPLNSLAQRSLVSGASSTSSSSTLMGAPTRALAFATGRPPRGSLSSVLRSFSTLRRSTSFDASDYGGQNVPDEKKQAFSRLKRKFPREWAVFSSIDLDGDGVIDTHEVMLMCDKLGIPDMADPLMDLMDTDGDGEIGFTELVTCYQSLALVRNAARLKAWNGCFGIGVAGNVAGHMEQAGEAEPSGAGALATAPVDGKPAAIFSFYVPRTERSRGGRGETNFCSAGKTQLFLHEAVMVHHCAVEEEMRSRRRGSLVEHRNSNNCERTVSFAITITIRLDAPPRSRAAKKRGSCLIAANYVGAANYDSRPICTNEALSSQ